MISILIPVYNVHVTKLISQLRQQLQSFSIEGELVVFDDGSDENYKASNKKISFPHLNYTELPNNIGRIAIRKKLAEAAKYSWLVFIDSDSIIVKKDYLKVYLDAIKSGADVVTGGTVYANEKPDCKKMLHWEYGSKREVITETNKSFRSNNFCIKKEIFFQLKFPEELNGYGHEDTWIGIHLDMLQSKVEYVNNPVLHNGVERTEIFLFKTNNALKNLVALTNMVDENLLAKHVRLYRIYLKMKKNGTLKFVSLFHFMFNLSIRKNLTSCNPSLRLFDIYRLAYFTSLMKEKRSNDKS